jgi:hypothetical protein
MVSASVSLGFTSCSRLQDRHCGRRQVRLKDKAKAQIAENTNAAQTAQPLPLRVWLVLVEDLHGGKAGHHSIKAMSDLCLLHQSALEDEKRCAFVSSETFVF